MRERSRKLMSEEYFVLVMEEYFGVFDVGASGYPEKLLKNMECVCVIRGNREVDDYLLEHPNVGRNVLNKCEFHFPWSVGQLYYHEAKKRKRRRA